MFFVSGAGYMPMLDHVRHIDTSPMQLWHDSNNKLAQIRCLSSGQLANYVVQSVPVLSNHNDYHSRLLLLGAAAIMFSRGESSSGPTVQQAPENPAA